jgi:serine/threonine protein kinase
MTEIRIHRCLGRGGFGEVYKGTMTGPGGVDVDVAVKVLRGDLGTESQGLQRLRDEGRLLGRLTHPTILRVYDLVLIDGRAALVSEYVSGEDLGRMVREDRVPPRPAFEIVAQVAAALDAAWSWPSVTDGKPLHLVHRDIKPDNIRIDPHGVVKLLDFGIAQAQTVQREAQTSVNTIMGSTQYLAPERLVQQEVGPESDVFALGCTLFEVLTGEALFARRSMRQMYLLMVQEDRFEQYLAERCGAFRDRLVGDRAIALIRATTCWRKAARPTAAEVASRCDAISDSTDGPTLTQWCRVRTWPPPPDIAGPLNGHTFGVTAGGDDLDLPLPSLSSAKVIRPDPLPTPAMSVPVPAPPDPKLVSKSLAAAGGPLPWSSAEVVAVFPTPPPARPRVPQLERLWPEPPKGLRAPADVDATEIRSIASLQAARNPTPNGAPAKAVEPPVLQSATSLGAPLDLRSLDQPPRTDPPQGAQASRTGARGETTAELLEETRPAPLGTWALPNGSDTQGGGSPGGRSPPHHLGFDDGEPGVTELTAYPSVPPDARRSDDLAPNDFDEDTLPTLSAAPTLVPRNDVLPEPVGDEWELPTQRMARRSALLDPTLEPTASDKPATAANAPATPAPAVPRATQSPSRPPPPPELPIPASKADGEPSMSDEMPTAISPNPLRTQTPPPSAPRDDEPDGIATFETVPTVRPSAPSAVPLPPDASGIGPAIEPRMIVHTPGPAKRRRRLPPGAATVGVPAVASIAGLLVGGGLLMGIVVFVLIVAS